MLSVVLCLCIITSKIETIPPSICCLLKSELFCALLLSPSASLLHACPFFTNATFPFSSARLPPPPPHTHPQTLLQRDAWNLGTHCKLRAANSHTTYTTITTTTCFSGAKRALLVIIILMSTQSPIIVTRAEHLILMSMINVKRTRFNVVLLMFKLVCCRNCGNC